MRRIFRLSICCLVALGCNDLEQVVDTTTPPTAGVRFINAVPDTGAMDFRFVDIVESNAHWNIAFRNNPSTSGGVTSSTQVQYKNTQAGARHFRIFMSGTTAAVASQVVKDSTFTFDAGKLYTVVIWGNARGGATPMRVTIFEETVADPGAQVALRVINTATSVGAVDVKQFADGGTAPATPTWAAVAPLSVSTYVTAAPGQKRFTVEPAGGGAAIVANALALPGAAKTVDIEALPGTTIAGSAVTAIIWPRSVAGSAAPAGFTTPAVTFIWDRRPPR
jgi:uncharacterized protein DUF4397